MDASFHVAVKAALDDNAPEVVATEKAPFRHKRAAMHAYAFLHATDGPATQEGPPTRIARAGRANEVVDAHTTSSWTWRHLLTKKKT